MKILIANYLYKPNLGGVENSIRHLSSEFNKKKISVDIVASNKSLMHNEKIPLFENDEVANIFRFEVFNPKFKFLSIFSNYVNIYRARRLILKISKNSTYDLIICRDYRLVIAASTLKNTKLFYILPGVANIQESIEFKSNGFFHNTIKKFFFTLNSKLQKRAIFLADKNFVFSENMRLQLQQIGLSNSEFEICFPGVDNNRFNNLISDTDVLSLREKYNIKAQDIVLLVVGRLVKAKGIHVAIKCLSSLNTDNVKLLIVGSGPLQRELEDLAREINVTNQVIFVGAVSKPEVFYSLSDIFLMTSYYEPFGQTILEAMSSSLPVVGFNRDFSRNIMTATEEIIINNKGGLLVNEKSEFYTSVNFLMLNPDIRIQMGNFNRNFVEKNYSWEFLSEHLLSYV